MSRSADIDRIFAHIGTPDMKYHEFEPAPDTDAARGNWSLLHSATATRDESGDRPVPLRPVAPEQRAEVYRERVAERAERREQEARAAEREGVVDSRFGGPRVDDPRPGVAPVAPERSPGGLQQVFSRLSGRPTEPQPQQPEPSRGTPLSQVFKRLT
jgi:hypothetical protein